MPKVWDTFEWDDENKKSGNVQHLREHDIELRKLKNVSFTAILFVRTSDLQMRLVFQDKGNRLARIFTGWDMKPKKKRKE